MKSRHQDLLSHNQEPHYSGGIEILELLQSRDRGPRAVASDPGADDMHRKSSESGAALPAQRLNRISFCSDGSATSQRPLPTAGVSRLDVSAHTQDNTEDLDNPVPLSGNVPEFFCPYTLNKGIYVHVPYIGFRHPDQHN